MDGSEQTLLSSRISGGSPVDGPDLTRFSYDRVLLNSNAS